MQQEALEDMDTPGLDRHLQEELAKEATDADLVRQVANVLRNREQGTSMEVTPEMQAVLDQFESRNRRKVESEKLVHRNWVPRAAAALVAVIIAAVFMLSVLPVEAQGGSWWDRLTQWTGEVFEFISHRNAAKQRPEYEFSTNHPGLQDVYDAVVELGVTDPVVPMWLPEGYVLEEIKVTPYEIKTSIYARFSCRGKFITYTVDVYGAEEWCEYNIDEKEAKEYENAGVTHYIMQNNEVCVAVWTKKNVECSLTINGPAELMHELLRSIYSARR